MIRCALAFVALFATACFSGAGYQDERPLTIVVMDPLSKRLACACVQGYAQRDYDKLGQFLEGRTGRPVRILYAADLARAFDEVSPTRIDLVIGKHSLVKADAAECKLAVRPICMLTGLDGTTTLTGLFVAKKGDAVKSIADIGGRRILFGPADSDEKHSEAFVTLRKAGISIPKKIETRPGCSDAALEILDSKSKKPPIGVISSYALALIEGCGTVPRGALKVIGKTGAVPFIAVFATSAVGEQEAKGVLDALLAAKGDPKLLQTLESKGGFVVSAAQKPRVGPVSYDWPGWRGPNRNGLVPWLPEKLPAKPRVVWRQPLTGPAHGGIVVGEGYVVVPDRNEALGCDVFRCFRAVDGKPVWKFVYDAPGKLDFGGSPRASPQIDAGRVYLLGAFGHLHCLELASGRVVWKKSLLSEFGTALPTWGMASSPLVVGDAVIVNPGAREASLVALDRHTGDSLWKSRGAGAAYASLIVGEFGGKRQIVGFDAVSIGGWDVGSGSRLWSIEPENTGDFNVPTPVGVDGKLIVATENNGARLYGFGSGGLAQAKPIASFADLAPDIVSPIVVGDRLFGLRDSLYCLDIARGLKLLWTKEAPGPYASFFASGNRLLIASSLGELLLIKSDGTRMESISRVRLLPGDQVVYAHPALTGDRLFYRDASNVTCVALVEQEDP